MFLKEMRYLISQIRHLISHLINVYKKIFAYSKRTKTYSSLMFLFGFLSVIVPVFMTRIYDSSLKFAETGDLRFPVFVSLWICFAANYVCFFCSDILTNYENKLRKTDDTNKTAIQPKQTEKNNALKQPKGKKFKLCNRLAERFAAIGRKIQPCLTNINVTVMDVHVRRSLDNANKPLNKAYISVHSNDYDLDYTAVFAFQGVFLPEKLSLQKGDIIPAIIYKNDANNNERYIKALVLENELPPAELAVQNYRSLPYGKENTNDQT